MARAIVTMAWLGREAAQRGGWAGGWVGGCVGWFGGSLHPKKAWNDAPVPTKNGFNRGVLRVPSPVP